MRVVFSFLMSSIAALILNWQLSLVAHAQDKPAEVDAGLAARMEKEKAARAGCKAAICKAGKGEAKDTADIKCDVVKTWPEAELKEKILKGKVNWPWGHAQCEAPISLRSDVIASARSQPSYEAKIGKHQIRCVLSDKDGKDSQRVGMTIDPVVKFEKGLAVKAQLNWTDLDGTAMAKATLWSATALDNTFNVLQGSIVEQINEFFGPKCDEVK